MGQPLNIVMTPVRNESWVLRAFLEATSLWSDYIIIADQMSTDGSREIARSYPKVILIDNNTPEFNEAERQDMLISKAREIADGRDTLLWGLDADEVLSANFMETDDWQRILDSKPGDVFWFKWAEICPDKKTYWISNDTYYPWLFHDDGKEPHGNYVRNMHSMRIPYPKDEKQMYYVDGFKVLHMAYLNQYRVASKRRFYQFVDWELNHRNPVSLSRNYSSTKKGEELLDLPDSFLYRKEICGFDLLDLVDSDVKECYMDDYVKDRISHLSIKELRKLDIWDEVWVRSNGLEDPRGWLQRQLHWYLHRTMPYSDHFWVKSVDKLLKKIV